MLEKPVERSIGRVLVTGATGFIGSALVERLRSANIPVRALVRESTVGQIQGAGVETVFGDLLRPETLVGAVHQIDTVFHAAALVGPAHAPASLYRNTNVEGTRALVDACITARISRFVHVSTVAVVGHVRPGTWADEESATHPMDLYGASKLEAERIVRAAAAKGFPAVLARPMWVYGAKSRSTRKLFKAIARRRLMIVGRGCNTLQPIAVEDVVEGLMRSATCPSIEGHIFHFPGPDLIPVQRMCQIVADTIGVSLPRLRPPMWLGRGAAFAAERLFSWWGGRPPLDHHKINFFRVNHAYTMERATKELGWIPECHFAEHAPRLVREFQEMGLL